MDASIWRTGGIAATGVALFYLASAICAVLMPPELQGRPDISPHQFWMVLSQNPAAHLLFHWAWIGAGLCGIGAVPAISRLVWVRSPGAMVWSGAAALFGFATMARSHLMEQAWDRRVIANYPTAEAAYQQAVHVVAGLALDVPDGVLTYGAIGIWVALVSALGLSGLVLPVALCWLGFATAAAYVAGVFGYAFEIRPLVVVAVGVGGFVLMPAWWGWMGRLLLRRASATSPAP